jgi:uncharacterized protein (DUF433 family)
MTFSRLNAQAAIYGDRDPRLLPAYPVVEAARYLGLHASTLSSWFRGPAPLLATEAEAEQLSFTNLVEAFVLKGLRETHHLSMQQVRRAVAELRRQYPNVRHPLAHLDLRVAGSDLYADKNGQLVDVSRGGQLGIRRILDAYLERVDRNADGVRRLYPFTRAQIKDAPRSIVIDPTISFGRPVIANTSIPTAVLRDRWKAGDSISELAEDYDRTVEEIEEAIRYEAA